MRHIKSINEFRTVGFRYSEPTVGFSFTWKYSGKISKEQVVQSLESIDELKFENVEISRQLISKFGGTIFFDIYVYNESEVETIINNLTERLNECGIKTKGISFSNIDDDGDQTLSLGFDINKL